MEARRVGVYICHCGTNIAGTVDVEEVIQFAQGLPSVVVARNYKFMCSDPGQELIKKDVKELELNRVVVAACSPRMHEPTFRRTCQDAGLNPYLYEQANIREHCSWVHLDGATEKAKALISAAVNKVYYNEPLEPIEVPVIPAALVLGGGIAGIQAALQIADAGHKVYLVEREPSIGGHMIQLDKTFPTLDCAACILTPKMNEVGAHPNIELFTWTEVEEVSGFIGNFKVKIRKTARFVEEEKCTGCGTCEEKCPARTKSEFEQGLAERKAIYRPFPQAVPNVPVIDKDLCIYMKTGRCRVCLKICPFQAVDFQQQDQIVEVEVGAIILATGYQTLDPTSSPEYGYGKFKNVFTALEFERLCNASGPTGGEILLKDGRKPESIAIVHCVGSRDERYHEYCSRVCCMYALKFAHLIKERLDAQVYHVFRDLRCFGKGYEEFYQRVLEEGAQFIKGKATKITEKDGKLVIECEDTWPGQKTGVSVDMVVLCTAIEPRPDAERVARLFSIARKADGFFLERHPKLDPIATSTDGIFIAGCCQGPKDIPDTVAQASAAASQALALLKRGKVEIEPITAKIESDLCSGCKICNALCPFGAISFDKDRGVSQVNEVLCKGCGLCVAACPTGVIEGKHFTTEQIVAELVGALI